MLQVTQLNSAFPIKVIVVKPANGTLKKHKCQSVSLHFVYISEEQHFVNKSGPKNTSCVSNGCNKTILLETSFLFAWMSPLEFHQNIGSFTFSVKC